jgi:hypothetical protein
MLYLPVSTALTLGKKNKTIRKIRNKLSLFLVGFFRSQKAKTTANTTLNKGPMKEYGKLPATPTFTFPLPSSHLL